MTLGGAGTPKSEQKKSWERGWGNMGYIPSRHHSEWGEQYVLCVVGVLLNEKRNNSTKYTVRNLEPS